MKKKNQKKNKRETLRPRRVLRYRPVAVAQQPVGCRDGDLPRCRYANQNDWRFQIKRWALLFINTHTHTPSPLSLFSFCFLFFLPFLFRLAALRCAAFDLATRNLRRRRRRRRRRCCCCCWNFFFAGNGRHQRPLGVLEHAHIYLGDEKNT